VTRAVRDDVTLKATRLGSTATILLFYKSPLLFKSSRFEDVSIIIIILINLSYKKCSIKCFTMKKIYNTLAKI